MMKNNELNIDCIVADAGHLKSAIAGIETFLLYRVSGTDVSLEDIDQLTGLIKSVRCLSSKHRDELESFSVREVKK